MKNESAKKFSYNKATIVRWNEIKNKKKYHDNECIDPGYCSKKNITFFYYLLSF